MATHIVDKRYPQPIGWGRWARNGQVPDGKMMNQLGGSLAHSIAFRKKIILEKWWSADDIPEGASGTTDGLFFCGTHTGHNVDELWAIAIFAPAYGSGMPGAAGLDPYAVLVVRDGFSGGSIVTSNAVHYGISSAAPGDAPDEMSWGNVFRVAVNPDTDYRIWLRMYNFARLHSICIWEHGKHPSDDTDTGCIDPRCGVGQRVLDSRTGLWLDAATKAWRDSGQQIANFVADSPARAPSINSTGAVPLCDGLWRLDRTYCASRGSSTIPVRMAVRAVRTAGAGATAENLVRFISNSGDVTITGIDDSTNWYTATGTIPAGGDDWYFEAATASTDTIRIDCACVWEEDP